MLDIYEAIALFDIKANGRTSPLVIDCECTQENIRNRQTLLVKCLGLPEIDTTALYCELLGNLLAREVGIETPKPFIVSISEDFVKATMPSLWEKGLSIKSGLAVGCEYFSQGFTAVKSETFLSKELLDQATLIYGFDLLTQNPDRRENNPNCAVKGNRIIAFDFEKCFSFLYPILGVNPEAWELSKLKLAGDERHIFANKLKSKENELNWQPLVEKVKQINRAKCEEVCNDIPTSFGNHTNVVGEHFESILNNINQVVFELQRSLL